MQTEAHRSAGQMVSMTPHTSEDLRTPETLRQENRTLRWKAKQLGKQLGRQGETIFRLRNEIAALRQVCVVRPGDIERFMASSRELREVIHMLRAENRQLREKLAAKEQV